MDFGLQMMMTNKTIIMAVAAVLTAGATQAQDTTAAKPFSRFSIGGYGEAVATRNFYSGHFNRYRFPEQHKDDNSHGQFDLPHVVINIGYDFGRGWTMGTEIEFEHGGTESAVEIDADESGEYEAEIERGGEVGLEQFWLQKSFGPKLNIRMGEMVVPVGAVNKHHMPIEFYTVYRPEGESSMLPCTWHQTGVSVWGQVGKLRYEAMFLSGLDAERFGADCFVKYGAASPYEFKIANSYAGAARIDFQPIGGLRLSASGYCGTTFNNTLKSIGTKYEKVKGVLTIGAFDFQYRRSNLTVRGNALMAHLSDADEITAFNKNFPTHVGQDGSPSKHQPVASDAATAGGEIGYNVFGHIERFAAENQKFIVFGRYEYYNSMLKGTNAAAYEWCEKQRIALGINYYPVPEIVVKAEYSERFFKSPYNNEPSVSVGVAYCGWFK